MEQRTALVLGASGLTGQNLLNLLLDDPMYTRITIYVRKLLASDHPKLEQHIVNYDGLDQAIDAEDVFCCLGTTIKKAGNQQAFRLVDLVYPQRVAELQLARSKRILVISAVGADANSSIFYSRTKGQMEKALMILGYQCLCIFRPSFIIGERSERRTAEKIGMGISKLLSPLLIRPLKKYQAVTALGLAKSMQDAAHRFSEGVHIIPSNESNAFDK